MGIRKPIDLKNDITLKELERTLKNLKKKGFKPFIKGKGGGTIKLDFE